jgi:hypothetical protein
MLALASAPLQGGLALPDRVGQRRPGQLRPVLLYIEVAALFAGMFAAGRLGLAPARYGFVAFCAAIGWQAWRQGPARHLEMSVILFVWAPFLRRVMDLSAGFDPAGFMLVGPLLALLPPCLDLYGWLITGRLRFDARTLPPYLLMGLCLLYGLSVSVAGGDLLPAAITLAKTLPPILYCVWLAARGAEQPNVMEGAARGFLIAMPAAGAYCIYQYFYLPDWDSYWMTMTEASAQGFAEAEKVRVFGPMNSAESLGHFALAAILLLAFVRRGLISLLLCVPVLVGLMLSSYRTAWLGLALGVASCGLNPCTRARAGLVAACAAVAIAAILATTSFGEQVTDRFLTLASLGEDGSGEARTSDLRTLFDHADQWLVGLGIGGLGPFGNMQPRVSAAPTGATDGIVLTSVLTMGVAGGCLYMLGVLWSALQSLPAAIRAEDSRLVAAGAVVLANLAVLPLTDVTHGEIGFLFWAFLGIVTAGPMRAQTASRAPHS